MSESRARWGSRLGFIIAASGSAVGLGNIWKFPYIAGNNGGGAFVLVYLLCIGCIALPLMIAEIGLGKLTQRSPVFAFSRNVHGDPRFRFIGIMGVVSAFVVLSFYSVVGGWTIDYVVKSFSNGFQGLDAESIGGLFDTLYMDGFWNTVWHLIFVGLCGLIVWGGVKHGIERWSKVLMSLLFLIVLVLVGRSLSSPGAVEGVSFIFTPDFSKLTSHSLLDALGHAFFTLSLAMGAMITYGSYLDDETNIGQAAVLVTVCDTIIALLACLIIFPIVFSYGMEPGAGPGLVFKTLPVIFSKIGFGQFFAVMFFCLLLFAAITSAISLLEVVTRTLMDGLNWSREKASGWATLSVFIFGLPSAWSGSWLSNFKLIRGKNFFDTMDYLASNWLMPLGGLFLAFYFGWFVPKETRESKFINKETSPLHLKIWVFFLRFIVPLGMGFVFISLAF